MLPNPLCAGRDERGSNKRSCEDYPGGWIVVNVVKLQPSAPANGAQESALAACVTQMVRRYLADLGGTACEPGLHALLMAEVEAPLLREVMAWHGGNQSRAAAALGINRATLRKKLAARGIS